MSVDRFGWTEPPVLDLSEVRTVDELLDALLVTELPLEAQRRVVAAALKLGALSDDLANALQERELL